MTASAAPNDPELLAEFTRVVLVGTGLDGALWVEVCAVTWPDPHTPRAHWEPLHSLPAYASAAAVAAAQAATLNDPRFFAVCAGCGRRHPCGWMHGVVCQGCAERWPGTRPEAWD